MRKGEALVVGIECYRGVTNYRCVKVYRRVNEELTTCEEIIKDV